MYTWSDKFQILKHSLGMIGPLWTLRYVLIYLLGYLPGSDKSFDRKYGTETTGLISSRKLAIADSSSRTNAIIYLPAPEKVTRYMLDSLPIDYSRYTFVDYGSGKGRVLLVASMYPFDQVLGVELSEHLHRAAQANISVFPNQVQRCSQVASIHQNALDFQPPPTQTVFHFYHPFLPQILRPVLENIRTSLQEHPRSIYILYLYHLDYVAALFDEMEFLTRVKEVKCVNSQYNWALYTNQGAQI